MIQTLGHTTHLVVMYDDTVTDSQDNAAAVLAHGESDLMSLGRMFAVDPTGFGPATVLVRRDSSAGCGYNYGYVGTETSIVLDSTPRGRPGDQQIADDGILAQFAAERPSRRCRATA